MDPTTLDMQAVQNFLRLAKGAQNKDDFLSRVREFDQKFIDGYPAPIMTPLPNIPKSNSQTGNTFKQAQQQVIEPPKNPFVNSAQQKYRNTRQNIPQQVQITTPAQGQSKYPQLYGQVPPQMPYQMQGSRMKMATPAHQIPHSRSQTNFYRQEDQFIDDFGVNNTYAHQFYGIDQALYRQNAINRSYSQLQPPQMDPRTKNPYQGTQPYIQNNQFLPNYETQEPEYVKYYKKVIPQPNPKANFSQTPRSNPFKQP